MWVPVSDGNVDLVRPLLALFVLAGVSLTATLAAAQESSEHTGEFKAMMAEGVEHYRDGEYQKALGAFRSAEQLASPPSLQYNIGRTFQAMGRCEKAKSVLWNYLAHNDLTDEQRTRGRERLQEIEHDCQSRSTSADSATTAPPSDAPDRPDVNGDSNGNWQRVAQITGLVAGGGLVVGAALNYSRVRQLENKLSEYRREEGIPARDETVTPTELELESEGQRAATQAHIFLASGLGLVTVSTIWLVVDLAGPKQRSPNASLTFAPAPTPLGLGARLRW